ncbi:hypothetical protein [Micromonospora parathelypteridis]|uniref:Lipoprotein n=1 Tax=Micromonospora parathelypteridis TaxID=1839617 RepID=A0A840VL83_9ACTN|nr:hypothetical protein [Micromonospora parathelypteridis]MBB5477712.1 hypothetical protein [Micromonospora parathelypteridis]GGO11272.1 hypothetical protein GCM10011576_19510 [Micromonospora parathelypteridis]
MTQATGSASTIRRTVGAVAAMLATTTLLGGCGPKNEPASAPQSSPSASPTVDPKQALLDAVPDGTEGTFQFSGKDSSSTLSGRIDHASKAIEINTTAAPGSDGITTKMSFLLIGEEVWVKAKFSGQPGLPKFPDKWMKLDRTKLADSDSIPAYDGADQGNAGPLIEAATSVKEQSPGKYVGVIDMSVGNAAQALEEGEAAALGEAARTVPFTAVVDADKHLTSLTLKIPAAGKAKAYDYVVNYADYGTTPKISVPTGAAVTNAPKMAYEMLNG